MSKDRSASQETHQAVRKWLEEAVIGLNLCPFAKPVFITGKIRMVTVEGDDLDHLVTQFLQELAYLDQKQGPETTTLLITPSLTDFEDYLETYQNLDGLLDSTPYRGRYQIASFHPDYYFEGAEENDIENYTNRSPVPIIHIINENDISRAVDFYGDIEKVPETNKATLKKLGAEKVLALFASFKPKP